MEAPRSFPLESQTDDRTIYYRGSLVLRSKVLPVNIWLWTAQYTAWGWDASGALGQLAAQAVRAFAQNSVSQPDHLPLLAVKASLVAELPSLIFVGPLLFPRVASTSPMCSCTVMASRWLSLKSGSPQTSHWNLMSNSNCESYPTNQHLSGTIPSWGPGSSGWGWVAN